MAERNMNERNMDERNMDERNDMDLSYFCRKIALPPKAAAICEEYASRPSSREEYRRMKKLFTESPRSFFRAIQRQRNHRQLFLYYYCRLACDVHEKYAALVIPDSVYWDTFSDITIWCNKCMELCGEYGIECFDWLYRHINLRLFCLGRLQYEPISASCGLSTSGIRNFSIPEGKTLLNVHIPAGSPLTPGGCDESIRQAVSFFEPHNEFLCHSWLLDPALKEILPQTSNILLFQKRFQILRVDYNIREAEERIFSRILNDPADYPEATSLQKNAKKYLMSGRLLGSGLGTFTVFRN